MEKRRLGKTNFLVSVIGFGGIPIQRVSREEAIKIIGAVKEAGINFIDTARGYTVSESLIGCGLEEHGRENFILATKSGKRDYNGILEELNISLKNLNTDYIDLFQFHNIKSLEELDFVMGHEGGLKALKEAKSKGIIKEIGITSHMPEVLDKAMDTGEFATIQCPYNPVERQAEEVFRKANKLGIGVIVMKPLAGGAIQNADLSLRFITNNPNVTVAIPGMDSVEQVIENAKIGEKVIPLNEEEKTILFQEAKELGTEFCRRCGYCMPCPQGIDIPSQFLMEGYYKRYNLKEWALDRYHAMEFRAKDCIQCGSCEKKCPYNLPIREMLKRVDMLLEK